jgi:hypothetical protein
MIKKDIIETENSNNVTHNKNNKIWYVVGIVTFVVGVGIILWYFDIFNLKGSGSGSRPGSGSNPGATNDIVEISYGGVPPNDNVETITITNNQSAITPVDSSTTSVVPETSTSSSISPTTSIPPVPPTVNASASSVNNDPVALMNQDMAKFNAENPINPKAESSLRSFNRFDVLDKLDENNNLNRPNSPTGSTDSTETITPNTPARSRVRSVSNFFSRNNK